jgi:hypothetical protein
MFMAELRKHVRIPDEVCKQILIVQMFQKVEPTCFFIFWKSDSRAESSSKHD